MQALQFANLTARTRFRRFFSNARRFWEDGRHSGVLVTRRRCFASAAQRHGIPEPLFDRLYSACFAEHHDPMAELNEYLDARLTSLAQDQGTHR
ncbi:MAG: hypothetical protein KDH15_06560 [Rhodocyclaceae bacterium]|nr:hypothetical protein [Rhodocyclaceae bacterium]